jgi:hypothetical protein
MSRKSGHRFAEEDMRKSKNPTEPAFMSNMNGGKSLELPRPSGFFTVAPHLPMIN